MVTLYDRVQETTTTSGTGSFTLGGAVQGFQAFSASIGVGNGTYYVVSDPISGAWEVGSGTLTSGTVLTRTAISSSNSNGLVTFVANTKQIFHSLPASKWVISDSLPTPFIQDLAPTASYTIGTDKALVVPG